VRRVVVTGMGVVSPIGQGRQAFFASLLSARSGIRPVEINLFDRLRMRIGGQVKDFDASLHFPKERVPQLDRFSQFALVAAREAWAEADANRTDHGVAAGVYFGTGLGGAATVEAGYEDLFRKDLNRVKPLSVIAAMPHAAAANIAIEFGIKGPCLTYAVACASSAVAVGEAHRAIRSGALRLAIAGGAEALLVYGIMKSWEALMTLAVEDKAAPETSCRPFAQDRTGLVLGEGAAVLVLEDLEHATARGAKALAEIVGYGISNDAVHLSRPDAGGQVRAIQMSLMEAERNGLSAGDIGYVNAHGTATRIGDRIETEALKTALGRHAHRVAVSSTKALHGHLMGAAGATELIAAIMAMEHGVAPPTAHLYKQDPECDLDYVPLVSRPLSELKAVMSNSFAFGGTNAVLVARRFDDV
jgi:3-oxoacyl-[acyl-carrier-protein] synthase II